MMVESRGQMTTDKSLVKQTGCVQFSIYSNIIIIIIIIIIITAAATKSKVLLEAQWPIVRPQGPIVRR